MHFKTRLFFILWSAGLIGILSFLLLVDLDALVSTLRLPPGTEIPTFTLTLRLLGVIQPAILLLVAVLIGVFLSPKLGLSSPIAEAVASGGDITSALRPQIVPGIVGGLIGGGAIVLIALVLGPFLAPEVSEGFGKLGRVLPIVTRFLYGGITEELLLRWGLMTLLVWVGWRLFQKGEGSPRSALVIGAILVSALVFAVGHLPIAYLLVAEPTIAQTSFVIAANSVFGLIAGYLYWKRGLESAMIAHALAHVVMVTASYFGAYF